MNKLDEICAHKREEVARAKAVTSWSDLESAARAQPPARGFHAALRRHARDGIGLIAEIKRASPSKGLIRADFHPAEHARAYAAGGAACLSILTERKYFQGAEDDLVTARSEVSLPALRKDFMVDPWQVAESRALGADAILLIVAALELGTMQEIESAAIELGMDVLVEVHNEAELEIAHRLRSRLIGINNRDLKSFHTDLAVSERLARMVEPGATLVGESGIASHDDCLRLARSGIRCFLVGESLMRSDDLEAATRALLGAQ